MVVQEVLRKLRVQYQGSKFGDMMNGMFNTTLEADKEIATMVHDKNQTMIDEWEKAQRGEFDEKH